MAFRDVYQMFLDIWRLYQKYANSNLTDSECEKAIENAELLRGKYNAVFTNEILTAVMSELSRIAKLKDEKRQ